MPFLQPVTMKHPITRHLYFNGHFNVSNNGPKDSVGVDVNASGISRTFANVGKGSLIYPLPQTALLGVACQNFEPVTPGLT